MKPSTPSRRAPQKLLLAALLLPWLPAVGQTITNPSFEANSYTVFPGYISGNEATHGTIPGWTASFPAKAGLNPAGGSPFANNGATPNGNNVAFIQWDASGNSNLKTTITDLIVGAQYNVRFRVNARNPNQPFLRISSDATGSPVVNAQIAAVSGAVDETPYRWAGYDFVATATSHELTIANTRNIADHTLLIDDVQVSVSTGAWGVLPWLGDDDSGVDTAFVYTHAYSFGSNAPVNINGVDFIGREGGTPGRFTISGLGNGFGNRTPNNVTGASSQLAKDFRFGGPPSISLQNLKPSTEYIFTLYGLGFDEAPDYYRSATFSSNLTADRLTVNLNRYGQGNGMLVTYRYTTDALGSPVVISYPETSGGAGSFHTSGFSNREAKPRTAPVAWTIEAWNGDESSGVSPNHHYTHAINLGSANGANVNGINFTGIPGANPAGTNYSSANQPSVYNGDINNVSGAGNVLARDFVYNGFPGVHNLSGLVPGRDYVFTLYSVGWDDGSRPGAFIGGVGEGFTILNQDEFGNNAGVRFEYRYTADASGTLKVTASGFDGGKSIHTYALSNREAEALVGVAPSITAQPVGATAPVGSPVVLRVGAVGSGPLTYVWRRGTTVVSDDGPTLEFDEVSYSDVGEYTVTVGNSINSVVSEPVSIRVRELAPGAFNTGVDPGGQPLLGGQVDPNFTIVTNADNPGSDIAYVQSAIPGAWVPNSETSKWIGPRENTVAAAEGDYVFSTKVDLTTFVLETVQISGRWATDNRGLAIRVNGVDTNVPPLPEAGFGALVPFTINLQNAPNLIKGVNTIEFVVNNASVGYVGLRLDSFMALGEIPAGTAPHIAVQPRSIAARHNSIVTLGVGASGSSPLSYQWYKGAELLSGETASTLDLFIDDLSPAGDYRVVVTGTTSVESAVATVSIPNANPVAGDNNYTTAKNVPLIIDFFDLVGNDFDPDGDQIFFESVQTSSIFMGSVVENDGLITYTPAAGFEGLDAFTYTINDGIWGGTATGTVYIEVTAPVASGPPGQLSLELSNGVIIGSFTGSPGASYALQRSTTLAVDSWTTVDSAVAPESGLVSINDPAPPAGRAFYRISYTP